MDQFEASTGLVKIHDMHSFDAMPTFDALTEAMAAGGAEAKRAFEAMMEMGKIDIAKIEAARRD